MSQNNINTTVLTNFVNQVKAADLTQQREIKIDINTAKQLSHTLSLVMIRLAGNYEGLISEKSLNSETITVSMDGGSWGKN